MHSALQQTLSWIENGFGLLGNQKQAQPVDKKQALLNVLVKNTLDQTAYTPQAKAYLQQMPVTLFTPPDRQMSQMHMGGFFNPGDNSVHFNSQDLPQPAVPSNPSQGIPGMVVGQTSPSRDNFANERAMEILRHEFGHALDANINGKYNMSYPSKGGTTADSYNFMNNPVPKGIKIFLNNYPNNPQVRDEEGFAQFGSHGQSALQNPFLGDSYKNIYRPMTPVIRYNPVFPE